MDTLLKTLATYIKEAICWLASLDLVIVKPLTDYTWPTLYAHVLLWIVGFKWEGRQSVQSSLEKN